MDTENDILELRIEGDGINVNTVKPSDVALLIIEFEKIILSNLQKEYPELDTKGQLILSLEDVKNGSIDLFFKNVWATSSEEIKKLVVVSFLALATNISNGTTTNLSNETITSLNRIQSTFKDKNTTINLKHKGEVVAKFNKDFVFEKPKSFRFSGDTVIYGELKNAGGEDKPNIHVKVSDDNTLVINCNQDVAKELGKRLYEEVSLQGTATWDFETNEIISFKLDKVLDYKSGNILNALDEIKKITNGYWDKFDTNEQIREALLKDSI